MVWPGMLVLSNRVRDSSVHASVACHQQSSTSASLSWDTHEELLGSCSSHVTSPVAAQPVLMHYKATCMLTVQT